LTAEQRQFVLNEHNQLMKLVDAAAAMMTDDTGWPEHGT
jgi:hypothetical protein